LPMPIPTAFPRPDRVRTYVLTLRAGPQPEKGLNTRIGSFFCMSKAAGLISPGPLTHKVAVGRPGGGARQVR
jgi:hypothetical protein